MNLLQMHIRPDGLMRFASTQGLARAEDEDLGYACHAWLKAMFGSLAPKPFRLIEGTGSRPARLLAYSTHADEALTEHAQTFADPLAHAALETGTLAGRAMPSQWRNDRRLGFEVLLCPMSRKDDVEKDVYQRHRELAGVASSEDRAAVYLQWLSRQIGTAASIHGAHLAAFRRVRMLRRSVAAGGGRRLVALERPQALLRGELTVRDPDRFAALLRRGVGRHRAFGYGMLLLRPAG